MKLPALPTVEYILLQLGFFGGDGFDRIWVFEGKPVLTMQTLARWFHDKAQRGRDNS